MEKAAELLRTGEHNVTEVALEVGYASPSHFSLWRFTRRSAAARGCILQPLAVQPAIRRLPRGPLQERV